MSQITRRESGTDFVREGYVVLPRLLTPREVALIRRAVDRRVEAPGDSSCERPNNTLVALRWDDSIVTTMIHAGGRVGRIGRAVGAADLRWISGYVSVKDPYSPPLWWHQDWWCWDHRVTYLQAPAQVALLCYLTDTHAGSGALRLLPGSHARSTWLHAVLPEAHSDVSTGLDETHVAMSDHPDQVTIALRGGDAVVLDYRLLHGTHANSTPRRRDCILLTFTPSWRDLPADIRGHLISHPALPSAAERRALVVQAAHLLPDYDGPRRDLDINRNAPTEFVVRG